MKNPLPNHVNILVASFFMLLTIVPMSYGQSKSEQVDELLKLYHEYGKFNGSALVSENGKVLYKVCKDRNPNTYFISHPDELDLSWFKSNDTVGICGATSTPMWLMEDVKKKILNFNIQDVA